MLSHISTIEHQSPPWLLRPDFHVFTLFHSLMFNNHQTIVYQQPATKQHSLKKKIMLNFDENVFESMLWMFLVHQCSYFHPVIRRWVFWQGLNPMQPPRLSCNSFWYLSSSLRLSGCCFDNFPHHTDDRDAYLWFYQLFSFLFSSWCLNLVDSCSCSWVRK